MRSRHAMDCEIGALLEAEHYYVMREIGIQFGIALNLKNG